MTPETPSLFPYQVEGARFLAHMNHALLADEMGLGKSAQVIRACDVLKENKPQNILILCPAVVRRNWVVEFEKFSSIHRDFTIVETKSQTNPNQTSVVCSYDLASSSPAILDRPWDILVLDEAHYLKSPTSKRTRAVYGSSGLVHKSKRVWALSGTPAPNHQGELWPILFTFGRTKLSYDGFIDRYCNHYQTPHGRAITGAKLHRTPELKEMLSKIMLRRKKTDVLKQLPPISYQDLTVQPGFIDWDDAFCDWFLPNDRSDELFEKIEQEKQLLEATTSKIKNQDDWLAALAALSNSIATLRRFVGLQKVEAVAKMVEEELSDFAYGKIVLFAIHKDVIEALRKRLSKFNAVTLYGGTPPEKRTYNVNKFQTKNTCRVFIGNIHAAGTGITLTAAHQVLFVEQDWVPSNNAQAAMRCHRIGQTRPVTVRFAALDDSVDIKVSQILKRKTRDLTALFDS